WLIAAVALVGFTVWTELAIAGRTPDFYGWLRPWTLVVALAGVAAVAALSFTKLPLRPGLALSIGGLLLLPAAWSVSAASNASLNSTLPQAGPQAGASGGTFGSQAFDDGTPELAAWLKSENTSGETWQIAVLNAQNGSRLIAQYGLSVMALGGFLGRDNAITVSRFADLVAAGDVRYVLVGGGGPGGGAPGRFGGGPAGAPGGRNFGGQRGFGGGAPGATTTAGPSVVMAAAQTACTQVADPSLPSRYQGAVYDCAGKADAL